ncbi:MAG: CHAT domain-containing protein [Cyanobacteria bacterium J06639_14]
MPAALHSWSGITNPSATVAAEPPQTFLREGLVYYEAEQFQAAIEQWQQAIQGFATQGDRPAQALTLGYLSLAYQQLGDLTQAAQSLEQSLALLESGDVTLEAPAQAAIYAKVLNAQGKLHWLQGEVEAALAVWQTAEQTYRAAEDTAGAAIAQINQAQALQHLGLQSQAQTLLQQVYQHLLLLPDTELKVAGLRHLSSVLRQTGDLEMAQSLLQESLSLDVQPASQSLVLLELGNTEWAIAKRLIAIGQESEAQERLQAAQQAYQRAIALDAVLPAQLNLIRLFVETGNESAAIAAVPDAQRAIDAMRISRMTAYANIHLAASLLQLRESGQTVTSDTPFHHLSWSLASSVPSIPLALTNESILAPGAIAERLAMAYQQAQTLQDKRAEAYALGQLGYLYEQTQQWTAAQSLTQQALLALETIEAPELQYLWEWQLGRLKQQQADQPGAVQAYEAAVNSLQKVRDDLLSVNADIQFSFRDRVEPVYRQYIELLLAAAPATPPSSQRLEQAIQTVDRLQLAELENYLGCTLSQVKLVDRVEAPDTAILYPIVLSDRVVIITQLPGTSAVLSYHETQVPQATLAATLTSLQTNLAIPGRTPEVIEAAQKVYNWLLRPVEAELAQASVQTLVFVLDGTLRNIPLSVLHDGNQYLIEKGYAVAIAPRLQLFTPGMTRSNLRAMIGGVGIPQELQGIRFSPIAKLQEELAGISQYVDSGPPLIDESFTLANIRQQLQTGEFSAIHWKTHGVFSSDPEGTYVLAFGERISVQDLNDLILLGSRSGIQPLELLVLSACETAQGDERAVLGLAGLAARTGTRSVLSTLWVAQDTPNTEFMIRFYEALSQPETSLAESVRQAQLALINEYGYTTPHIWSNYLLIGNWL